MLTNAIKKGMRVKLANGWYGTMYDNAKGNTRMVEVNGIYTEIGSVYAHDIVACVPDPNVAGPDLWVKVEHTPAQLKLKKVVEGAIPGLRISLV